MSRNIKSEGFGQYIKQVRMYNQYIGITYNMRLDPPSPYRRLPPAPLPTMAKWVGVLQRKIIFEPIPFIFTSSQKKQQK